MKFALALLVLGIVTFAVYSFTSKPNFDAVIDTGQSDIQAKLQSAEIYPKTAYTNNTLQIRIQRGTPDEYQYMEVRWYKNNVELTNASGTSLESTRFRKGDQIHAAVNLLGPDAMEQPVVTLPVTILNSPPRIISGTTALAKEGSDALFTRINATDPDGDPLRYSYKWYRNGSVIAGEKKSTLDIAKFAKDDEFYAEVTATDGEDVTNPYKCDPISIESNAPSIVSQPPSGFTPDRRYVYQLEVHGPDVETLTYELIKKPEGMTVSSTGLVDWELPTAELGTREYEVVVRVADATGGEAFQTFTIALSGRGKE